MAPLFIQRNPDMDREKALQQAREFLSNANPISSNRDENFNLYLQSAALFIMYGSADNELGMAGAEELSALAHKLRNITLDALLLESILDGTVLLDIDQEGELLVSLANPK